MTREEAIQRLTYLQDGSGQTYEALRMAIEALQTEGENGEGVVAYVCDNRKCGGDCDNCGRTTDIAHAKNFTRISDSYFERLDSVSVVRCKDCRFYSNDHLCQQLSRFGSIEPLADFYCAFGKRREESEVEE